MPLERVLFNGWTWHMQFKITSHTHKHTLYSTPFFSCRYRHLLVSNVWMNYSFVLWFYTYSSATLLLAEKKKIRASRFFFVSFRFLLNVNMCWSVYRIKFYFEFMSVVYMLSFVAICAWRIVWSRAFISLGVLPFVYSFQQRFFLLFLPPSLSLSWPYNQPNICKFMPFRVWHYFSRCRRHRFFFLIHSLLDDLVYKHKKNITYFLVEFICWVMKRAAFESKMHHFHTLYFLRFAYNIRIINFVLFVWFSFFFFVSKQQQASNRIRTRKKNKS